jgi:hypothetical protein
MSWAVQAWSSWLAMMARTRWAASRLVPRRMMWQAVGLGVFVLAFPGQALVQIARVGVAAAGHRHVQQCAAGVFTEHGMGALGGDGTVNLSNPRAIFAGSPPRFTRSRVTYEAYVVSMNVHTTSS